MTIKIGDVVEIDVNWNEYDRRRREYNEAKENFGSLVSEVTDQLDQGISDMLDAITLLQAKQREWTRVRDDMPDLGWSPYSSENVEMPDNYGELDRD